MKSGFALFFVLCLCLCMTSCATTIIENQLGEMKFENDEVAAVLSSASNHEWIELQVENKTENVIQLVSDLSTYSTTSGITSKLVPEGTKFTDSSRSVPSTVIAPKSKFIKGFVLADSISFDKDGGWLIDPWVPPSVSDSNFIFVYKAEDSDKYIVFSGPTIVSKKVGNVKIEKRFSFGASDKNRRELYELALEKARSEYGENITLCNLEFTENYSLLTMLFYSDMVFTADVYSY